MSMTARQKRSRAERHLEVDNLERRRALGQFFTPADVAGFIWDTVEVLRGRPWHEDDTVIDPACGDGAFLRVAIQRGQKRSSCYGIDIDQTLVPLWPKDAGVRGARLLHENGLANHPAIGVVPGAFDLVIGNPPFAGNGLKDLLKLLPPPAKTSVQTRSLFADAPEDAPLPEAQEQPRALSADERNTLDRLVRQLAGYQCWRLADESDESADSEIAGGSLFADLNLSSKRSERAAEYERMAKAITTAPADRPLNAARPEVRDAIRRMATTAIEVFFTERFVQLARPGGMIAVIVPESILASDQLGPLRLWLLQKVQLMAVVSLPHKVFTGVGANAKTGIVFGRRYTLTEERANAKAKEIAPGCRMTVELRASKVIMVSPNVEHPDWSLQTYLNDILEGARAHQERESKRSRK